jgi:hypothetical protein
MLTRFNNVPSERLNAACLVLKDTITLTEKVFMALPYSNIAKNQYATSLLVRIKWHAVGALRTFEEQEPFNTAPMVRSAFECLVYMKAAIKDTNAFERIIKSDLVYRERFLRSVEIAKKKLKEGVPFRQSDMPPFKDKKQKVVLEQMAQLIPFELYWHYYPLLSAEAHPSPLSLYKNLVVETSKGLAQINVNPPILIPENLALIMLHTLLIGVSEVLRLCKLVGFRIELNKLFSAREYVLLKMNSNEYI